MVKSIFFDRDGVINNLVKYDKEFVAPKYFDDFVLKQNSEEAFQLMKDNGFLTFIVTNQPDVVHNGMDIKELIKIKKFLFETLVVDDIFEAMVRGSKFYKPNNGMVEYFIEKYKIDRNQSYLIGDRWKDIVCGNSSGLTTVFIGNEYTSPNNYSAIKPDYFANDILAACKKILEIKNDSIIR
jgi:histidinol phosphatase-like enzyme